MAAPASPDLDAAYGPSELARLRKLGLATNKEIRRFKVAINTACPLRCEYCFIDKDSGEVISWDHVTGLVRFLLSSPGKVKKLLLARFCFSFRSSARYATAATAVNDKAA